MKCLYMLYSYCSLCKINVVMLNVDCYVYDVQARKRLDETHYTPYYYYQTSSFSNKEK